MFIATIYPAYGHKVNNKMYYLQQMDCLWHTMHGSRNMWVHSFSIQHDVYTLFWETDVQFDRVKIWNFRYLLWIAWLNVSHCLMSGNQQGKESEVGSGGILIWLLGQLFGRLSPGHVFPMKHQFFLYQTEQPKYLPSIGKQTHNTGSGWVGLGLCCLMTPGLSKDIRCYVN